MSKVTVIDYGMGNLLSVQRAFEHLGAEVELSHDASSIAQASLLVLPGVGAFGDGMNELHRLGIADVLRDHAQHNKPLLGICLGAQMLLDSSEEFGQHQGLGLIPGQVRAIPQHSATGEALKTPHMGWADLQPANDAAFDNPLLNNISIGSAVYFVHSYQAQPVQADDLAAVCDYDGNALAAMVRRGNTYGCQFHPEKSGAVGLKILQAFLELAA